MIRQNPQYWQRLRKDRRSAVAVLLTAIAAISATATLSMSTIPGSQYDARANPLYWLLMLPMAWWISGLANYQPAYVRLWKPLLALCCGTSAVCLLLSVRWEHDLALTAISFAITQLSAAGAIIAYRGSMVAIEGPAR